MFPKGKAILFFLAAFMGLGAGVSNIATAQRPEGYFDPHLFQRPPVNGGPSLQLTDLLSVVQPEEVTISADGSRFAYVYASFSDGTSDSKENSQPKKGLRQIWVQRFEGSDSVRIGPENADNSNAVWSPNGSKLAFYTSSGGQNYLAIWSVSANDVHITDVVVSPSVGAEWTPDGKYLLVSRPVVTTKSSTEKPSITILTSGPNNYELEGGDVVTPPGGLTGQRFGDSGADHVDLLLANVALGTVETVASDIAPTRYQLSPDGTKLFYTVYKGSINSDANFRNLYDVNVVSLYDKSVITLARNIVAMLDSRSLEWSHNGEMIAFLGGNLQDDYHESAPVQKSWWPLSWAYPVSCYILDLQHPGVLRRIGYRQFSPNQTLWSANDTAVYAISHDGTSIIRISLASGTTRPISQLRDERIYFLYGPSSANHLYSLNAAINGENRIRLIDPDASSSKIVFHKFQQTYGLSGSRDGSRLVYISQDVSHPPDVWVADNRFAATRQVTRLNPQIEGRVPDDVRSISWQVQGTTFYGTLLLPRDYYPGRRHPTILYIYGGARDGGTARSQFALGASGGGTFRSFPLFAARGYAVFVADSAMRRGSPMHDIAATVLPGVDKVVAMGIADPNRLGVFGWSYGGYSALSLIAETDRFKAAVAASTFSNLLTNYVAMHADGTDWTAFAESNQGHIGGTPWQHRERYIENSPFFYLDRVKTPVLLEYGDADTQVDPFASRETFVALRRLGKIATLVDYVGEGHGLGNSNQIDFSKRMIDWFDYWLKGINPDGTPVVKPDQTKAAADKPRSATVN